MSLREQVIDFFRLVAEALYRAARAGGVVKGRAIVVAELNHDEVAGFDQGQGLLPKSLRQIGATAEPANGAIDDVDSCRVEKGRERFAPAPLALCAVPLTVSDGGIADQKKGGQLRVSRLR